MRKNKKNTKSFSEFNDEKDVIMIKNNKLIVEFIIDHQIVIGLDLNKNNNDIINICRYEQNNY